MLNALGLVTSGALLVLLKLGLVVLGRQGLGLLCIFGDAVIVPLLSRDYFAL